MSYDLYKFLKLYVSQLKKLSHCFLLPIFLLTRFVLNLIGPPQGLPQGLKGSL